MQQLILDLKLAPEARFDNFCNAAAQPIIKLLQQAQERHIYLYGSAGSGKSHLLQAACHLATAGNQQCAYLRCQEILNYDLTILDGLENLALLALDDIDYIAANSAWEQALFHLYNRLLSSDTRLLIAASQPPANIAYQLPDLVSRLQAMLILKLPPCTDEEKLTALMMHAKARGLRLTHEVAQYLMNHVERNMQVLCHLLDEIETTTLAAQRRLTIPFLKQLYGW